MLRFRQCTLRADGFRLLGRCTSQRWSTDSTALGIVAEDPPQSELPRPARRWYSRAASLLSWAVPSQWPLRCSTGDPSSAAAIRVCRGSLWRYPAGHPAAEPCDGLAWRSPRGSSVSVLWLLFRSCRLWLFGGSVLVVC